MPKFAKLAQWKIAELARQTKQSVTSGTVSKPITRLAMMCTTGEKTSAKLVSKDANSAIEKVFV